MNNVIKFIFFMGLFISTTAHAGKVVLVEENHADISRDGITYVLDTYIVLLSQPYLIVIEREDGQPMDLEVAEDIAVEYIKPRGCTQPLKRLPKLDGRNEDNTKILIGVAC